MDSHNLIWTAISRRAGRRCSTICSCVNRITLQYFESNTYYMACPRSTHLVDITPNEWTVESFWIVPAYMALLERHTYYANKANSCRISCSTLPITNEFSLPILSACALLKNFYIIHQHQTNLSQFYFSSESMFYNGRPHTQSNSTYNSVIT